MSKVRELYRAGRVRSRKPADWTHKESTERRLIMVMLEDVLAQLGSARPETGTLDPPPSSDVRAPTATAIDRDEWSRITAQLEELRRTRDQVAGAREQAARLEEERDALRETLGEVQPRVERLERLSAAVSTGPSAGAGNSADGAVIPDPDVEVEWTVEEPQERKEAPRFSFLQRSSEDRWRAFTALISTASPMLARRLLTGWARLAEDTDLRWSRITLRARNGWHRFGDATAASRTRIAEVWPRRASVLRRPIVFGVIVVAALCILSGIALLRARTSSTPPAAEADQGTASSLTDDGSFATGFYPSPTSSTTFEEGLPGVDVHVNEAAGYLFSYPASWAIGRKAGVDRLRDPSGDVLMVFEIAPPGTLRSASDRVVGEIATRYSDVELETSPVQQTPQGLPSLVVGGHGIGPGRATMRFLVITIQGPDGNRAITVHFSPDARPLEWLPVIREVIASYRISTLD